MRRHLQSKNQQQYMQLAKDSQSQIPRSASYLAVSGSPREAGAGEKFSQMWLLFRAGAQLFRGPELVGPTEWARGSHY